MGEQSFIIKHSGRRAWGAQSCRRWKGFLVHLA